MKQPIPSIAAVGRRTPRLDTQAGGLRFIKLNFFIFMTSYRTALLATAATALSLAATPAALANGLTFTNYTTASGLGYNSVNGVYASGSNIYAATNGGLGISTNGGSSFTNYTTANGLGNNNVFGVYASGSNIYAATYSGGLGIASEPNPVPGPLPVAGAAAAFGFSRKLRRRLRAAASTSC